MKKILLTGSLLIMLSGLLAQDAKKLKAYLDAKQYDKAKVEVDAAISKNPADPLALYYKSRVYAALASDAQFKTSVPDAREQAFDAFKKAIANNKDNKLMLVIVQDQYKPIFDLYGGYYEAGIQSFNSANGNKSVFAEAMNLFSKTNEIGKYITENKWAQIAVVDTPIVLLMGQSAYMADKKDSALKYFKLLTDANIRGTSQQGLDYALPYRWLSYYYKEAKDDVNFMKYSSLGKQYFPKDDFFDNALLDYYRDKKDYSSLFKTYKEITTSYPDSFLYHFNYAADAFNYVYNSDAGTKVENKETLLKAVGTELQKAISIKPNDVNINLLSAQYYYNQGVDMKEQANAIKSTKPEDVKKKSDINAQAKDLFSKSISYAETSLKTLENNGYKRTDKSKYKSIANLMQGIYQNLNQADKVKFYQGKYDTADTKFVN